MSSNVLFRSANWIWKNRLARAGHPPNVESRRERPQGHIYGTYKSSQLAKSKRMEEKVFPSESVLFVYLTVSLIRARKNVF
jgi:hypothetical protein